MNNLMNISTMLIGIISIVISLGILLVFVFLNIKKGGKLSAINFIELLIAFVLAIFLAKPMLALFDKIFSFSMVFFNMFMLNLGQIDSFNSVVTIENYGTSIENFKNSSVGISSTLKSFFVKVFENTEPSLEGTTTLGAIASRSLSYILSLFLITLILFAVIFALVKVLSNFLEKKFKFKKSENKLKILGGIIGFFKGFAFTIILLITLSTIPIFGISIDYIGAGFQTTKIFEAPYQFLVNTEQDMYVNSINFNNVNKLCFGSNDEVEKGNYRNDIDSTTQFSIDFIINNTYILMETKNLTTNSITSDLFDYYIFLNNTIYLYQSNKLTMSLPYNTKNSTIKYKATIDDIKVDYVLKIV